MNLNCLLDVKVNISFFIIIIMLLFFQTEMQNLSFDSRSFYFSFFLGIAAVFIQLTPFSEAQD